MDRQLKSIKMISRIWHGWTIPENAEKYESLLKREIFEHISEKDIVGYHGIQLHRRDVGDEVEFVTIMLFESLESVIAFAGEEYEKAYVPAAAIKVLKRYDQKSQHYEVKHDYDKRKF